MLRSKKDSLKDIPAEVRHSLEFLDTLLDESDDRKDRIPAPTLRTMKNVPPDARKSLEILDSVLGEFEFEDKELRRSESADNLKVPSDDVTQEVNKSLEVLDRVLDEFQHEGGRPTVEKRPKVVRNESLRKPRHEDIRRSLEVLDSVLAEFDDCLESWDNVALDKGTPDSDHLRIFKTKENTLDDGNVSYVIQATDGSTSHDSGLSLQEQIKVSSPPPVPKRSASTKLSDRSSGLFNFSLADCQSFDSLPSDLASRDNGADLSTSGAITSLSAKDDDEVFKREDNNAKTHCCAKCGSEIEVKGQTMDTRMEKDISSSPFSQRRRMFEDRLCDPKMNVSPLLERAFTGSSFKVKSDRTKECQSEPSSLVFYRSTESDRSDSSQSSFASKYFSKATRVDPPRVDGLLSLPSNPQHAPNCNCKERIRQLQAKFAETQRLLKANKIRGLDSKPPSFVPPPPPPPEVAAKNARNDLKQLLNGHHSEQFSDANSYYSASNGSLNSESLNSEISETSHVQDIEKSSSSPASPDEQRLCDRCSVSVSAPLSETIEDIPKLLPTDALKRPHLGLSYSMEDDLSPGVKEILQTPSPRSGLSLSKSNRMTSLSTFSLSDSSLGYFSSQSDVEMNSSPVKVDKVPVSTIKFSTLPEGMDLHSLPSYYGQERRGAAEGDRKSPQQPLYRDCNFNHTSDPQLRSSSAPPPPEQPEKPKKKHFRGFSRKDKKDKRHDDNISVASYLSLDEGVILKSIDGGTSEQNAVDSGRTGQVEKKRWSALRSILGRR